MNFVSVLYAASQEVNDLAPKARGCMLGSDRSELGRPYTYKYAQLYYGAPEPAKNVIF